MPTLAASARLKLLIKEPLAVESLLPATTIVMDCSHPVLLEEFRVRVTTNLQ